MHSSSGCLQLARPCGAPLAGRSRWCGPSRHVTAGASPNPRYTIATHASMCLLRTTDKLASTTSTTPQILISALQRSPATKACLWTRIPCESAVHPPLMPALTCSNSVAPCVLFTCRCTAEVPGYKGLLVDKDTMRVCSTLFGRTELAEHSVVHVERLDSTDGTKHPELKVGCSRLHHSTSQHITI